MSFPRYPSYKDSGVEWLREVPEHWKVTRLKNMASINMGQSPSSDDCTQEEIGLPFLQGNADFGESCPIPRSYCAVANKLANFNDILFSVRAPVGAINIADQTYGIGRGLCAITPIPEHSMRFVFHALQIMKSELFAVATGSTYEAVSTNQVGNATCLAPPLPEQTQIATFLDRETAAIDALVAEQRRLMELLKEKRQAVISHAVTKGLNPDAPMKPSGIEWLGEVPEHWEVKRIKHLSSRISSGKTPLGGSEIYVDEGVTFLRSQNVYDEGLRLDDVVFITEAVDETMAVSRVRANDILLNITGASIGRSCVVPSEFSPANVNQHVCVIRLKNPSQVPFIGWLFKAATIKNQIDHAQNGAAREGLNFVQIGDMAIALPPAEEQQAIANFIAGQTAKFDTLTAETQRAIDLLQERRTALISAAVTGQIDVRAAL